MPYVIVSTPLLQHTDGRNRLEAAGHTVGECLRAAEENYPELKGWVLDDQGRIRQHVNVFVGDRKASLEQNLEGHEEVFVIQAISGGAVMTGTEHTEILIGTKKGLVVLHGARGGPLEAIERQFPGQVVEYAIRDPRSGVYYASVTHGQFGPHLYLAEDPTGEWEQAEGLTFPGDSDTSEASVTRIWVVEPGIEDGVLWAGVAPAALFKSEDSGRTWRLNESLWNDPTRPNWEGGLGGLCLHSICPWPGDPDRLTLAISSVGVWQTTDGGTSWNRYSSGLVPRYIPEEAREGTIQHCVHKLQQMPTEPDTFYMQFHGGVYRSDDGAKTWVDIGSNSGLPADFGFPIVAHPANPNRAYVIPLDSDLDRVTPNGNVRVYETSDRGKSWTARSQGLPQGGAYLTVLRQAFCHDGRNPLGLYFGARSGTVFGSVDAGATWFSAADNLPPVGSVRVAY